MENKVLDFIQKNNLVPPESTILVGLSGGPDSVCLLNLLNKLSSKLNIKVIAAHLNHEARQSAIKDEEFCKQLCLSLNINLVSEKISNLPIKPNKESKEEFWRNSRRYFFEFVAKEQGANLIALGHHLQDQQENFLIRLIRGTTLSGLTGIKAKEGIYIRPLLEVIKEEVLEYLKKHNLNYAVDESNISDDYLRNRVRKIIPALEECDNRFNANFLRTLNHLNSAENFILRQTTQKLNELTTPEGLDTKKLFEEDEYLQNKIVLQWLIDSGVKFQLTESFLQEILRFLKQPEGKTHQVDIHWGIRKKSRIAKIEKK